MRRLRKPRPPPDAHDAADAVLIHWRMDSRPRPPDNLLHGHYWEDDLPTKGRHPLTGRAILSVTVVLAAAMAAIAVAIIIAG